MSEPFNNLEQEEPGKKKSHPCFNFKVQFKLHEDFESTGLPVSTAEIGTQISELKASPVEESAPKKEPENRDESGLKKE